MGVCQSSWKEVHNMNGSKNHEDGTKVASQVTFAGTRALVIVAPIAPPEIQIAQEKSIIVCCANARAERPDKIMVIDVDPKRATYGQVLSFAELPTTGDELTHIGWSRTAASRNDMSTLNRRYLIAPCINTSRIYIFDYHDERISIHKCISEEVLFQKDLSAPYCVHSLPQRGTPLFISTLGDKNGHARGDFIVLDRKTFDVAHEGLQSYEEFAKFGGHFAVQPKFEFMISTEWGYPRLFKHGLLLSDLANGGYGNRLNVWRIDPRSLKQVIELDECDGCMTNVVRFLHNKDVNHGFACSAYGSSIFHIHVNSLIGKVCVDKVAEMGKAKVDGWMIESIPAMIADLVISMDDRFMYASAWLHGYVAQYDITDPFRVSLCSKIHVGESLVSISGTDFRHGSIENFAPSRRAIKDKFIRGGPCSLQLSLDGERLYVTTSFYRSWDAQFFPHLISEGTTMFMIDVDVHTKMGGMTLNRSFIVDFGTIDDDGPYLTHGMRLPTGDCTSESFAF